MIKIKVPATSANLGPGFDTLGIALDLFLELEIDNQVNSFNIEYYGEGKELIDNQKAPNLVLHSMKNFFSDQGVAFPPLNIKITNNIPLARGLGSSAAAIVAGVFGADRVLGTGFSPEKLIKFACALEGHGDNIVPAVIGGLTVVLEGESKVLYQKLRWPPELKIIIVVPEISLSTEISRDLLPAQVNFVAFKENLQRACFLLASLINGDTSHLEIAMEDKIVQEARKRKIPGFERIVAAGYYAGALGITISGAGPSILALCLGNSIMVGEAIKEEFAKVGIDSAVYLLNNNTVGIEIIETS